MKNPCADAVLEKAVPARSTAIAVFADLEFIIYVLKFMEESIVRKHIQPYRAAFTSPYRDTRSWDTMALAPIKPLVFD